MFQGLMMILCNSLRVSGSFGAPAPDRFLALAPFGQLSSAPLFIHRLPFGRVPTTALRMVLAHFREASLVCLVLLPFLEEWIDHHREIETDQKSPHGVSFWRTVTCGNSPTNPGRERRSNLCKHEPAGPATSQRGHPPAQRLKLMNNGYWRLRIAKQDPPTACNRLQSCSASCSVFSATRARYRLVRPEGP